MPEISDTIAAEATPPGRGSLRVVRVSGPGARPALTELFAPRGEGPLAKPRCLCLGDVVGVRGVLDRALTVFFPAPDSLTGQDVAEFHLHGSPGAVRGLLELLAERGVRPAVPGEFSYRAVLNGKMSVMEAEAVNALVAAETAAQATGLGGGTAGDKERELEAIQGDLLDLRASWEARIDFPEEVPEAHGKPDLKPLQGLIKRLTAFAAESRAFRQLREGWRVAIVGPVNTGKSSLFNALLKRERALVTPHPGTTRDVLEEAVQLGGYALVLLDVAGIRTAEDPVEALGVKRGLEAARTADGTLLVYDASSGWGRREQEVLEALPAPPVAIVANKRDLAPTAPTTGGAYATSALTGEGLERVVHRLQEWIEDQAPPPGANLLVSDRQVAAVLSALQGCAQAREAIEAGLSEDVALQGILQAQGALEDLLSGGSPEDLYDRIFSTFCIGK